jgi:pimeloyl-ACP methyl ester carboxylesterase
MQLLQLEHATLNFSKTGTGDRTLIAFHGFGQSGQVFHELAASLSDSHTVYLVDIFFHGNSEWRLDEQPLEKEFWNRLLKKFLDEQSINTFSLLGFSMGGKFVLATLEAFPDRVKEIFLLAPDGIKTSMWYSLATYPVAFRNLFKSMIKKPQRFNAIATFVSRIGLIDKGILRFVESQMSTAKKRKRVYYSWVVFRHLTFSMETIANLINHHNIRLVMILGKFDKVITTKNMHTLLHKVKDYQLELLETGHNGIINASIPILIKNYSSAGKI